MRVNSRVGAMVSLGILFVLFLYAGTTAAQPARVLKVGTVLPLNFGMGVDTKNALEMLASDLTTAGSAHTHRLTKDFFAFTSLGELPIKGKEEPQDAYVLLAPADVKTRIDASASAGLTPFVGRAKEMAMLTEALDKARSGAGQVVGIIGEARVGKSRILLEMRRLFPDLAILEGHCLHYGGSMAYLPVLDSLRSPFGIKEGEQEFTSTRGHYLAPSLDEPSAL